MTATLTRAAGRPPTSTTLAQPVRVTGRASAAAAGVTDEELLARVGRGDGAAWGELYRRHRGTVTGYLRNRVAVGADVEDLVHEGFLLARERAGDYRPEAEQGYTVRSWLCGRAGEALRHYKWNERYPFLAAADASRDAAREPVTETAAERERRPLSEPVVNALAKLPPAQRRAIQLRYLDGLSEEQAAEVGQCSPRAIRSSSEQARAKLREQLAELAPQARSPLQDIPRHDAARLALATVGADNVAGAQAWLRERGVRVSTTTMYQARKTPHERTATEARPVYTPSEQIAALPGPERARAAGRDYRARYGQLPSISQLAAATGVAHATTARALRHLKTEHQVAEQQVAEQLAGEQRQPTTAGGLASHARGDSLGHDVQRPAVASQPGTVEQRHRVQVHSQAAHSTPQTGRDHTATRHKPATSGNAAGRQDTRQAERRDERGGERDSAERADGADGGGEASGPPPASVSIARARVALAVISAHRAERDTRRGTEQAQTEQLNQWHHDDNRSMTGRVSTRAGRAHDGEDHTR